MSSIAMVLTFVPFYAVMSYNGLVITSKTEPYHVDVNVCHVSSLVFVTFHPGMNYS